jgi:hypothetical protein
VTGPRPAAGLDSRVVDGEAVLFDGETLHRLDPAATAVWELLDGRTPESELVRVLSERYGVDPAAMARDVATLVATLADRGLVER